MAQHALGREFNVLSLGDGKYVNLTAAGGVAFACYLAAAAGDTYTLTEAKDSGGTGAQVLAAITDYYTCTGDGTDAWVHKTQAAGSTMVTAAAAAQNAAVVEVEATQLSAGYKYVKLASTGSGLVTGIVRDLNVQRDPANLPKISA